MAEYIQGRAPVECKRRSLLTVTVLTVLLAGCGGSSTASSGSTTPVPSSSAPVATPSRSEVASPSATSAVTKVWLTFFAGTTPAAMKITLLQNGAQFAQVIRAQATSSLAKSTTARVTKVVQTSPTSAAVYYSILLGGKPALPGQVGLAVFDGTSWKVASTSFCALLTLEGTKVPAC